jgi:hypothetical protein
MAIALATFTVPTINSFPTIVDIGQLASVAGAQQAKQGFSWKQLRNWTAVGAGAGFTGGAIGCAASGPAYPVCVGLATAGGAASAAVWNVANQTGFLSER